MAAGLGVAALCGAVNGVCAARTPMPPFIITLATMQIARGAALRFNEGRPISGARLGRGGFLALGNERLFGVVPLPVLLMAAAFAASWVLLHRTRFGQHLYAIGGNREAARLVGHPPGAARDGGLRPLLAVRRALRPDPRLAALLGRARLGAGVRAQRHRRGGRRAAPASPAGSARSPGTLLGAVIIGILDKGLNQAGVHFSLQSIVKGSVILAAVYFDVRRGRAAR